MKQLLIIALASFALSAFAAEPAQQTNEKPKQEMKLAKKKDHSKDKKVAPSKSTAVKKAAGKKANTKSK